MKKIRKDLVAIGAAVVILAALLVIVGINTGSANVEFEVIDDGKIPQQITKDIIPEYRNMERALAFVCDDSVYVMVSRGEKPAAGYEIAVDKIQLKAVDDKTVMTVYARFADPAEGSNTAQVITYPIQIVKTQLTGLPDTIELISEYIK